MFTLNQPLYSVFWPTQNKLAKELSLILLGIVLLAFSAQIIIPWQPVPLTFQSATVILIGCLYGARLASFTVLGYWLVGLLGLPVFAQWSSGLGVFLGLTSGYLIGFLPAAAISGYLAQHGWGRNILSAFLAACLGAGVIFLMGMLMLAKFIGWHKAFQFGVQPFLLTEPVKLLAAAMIVPRCWKS